MDDLLPVDKSPVDYSNFDGKHSSLLHIIQKEEKARLLKSAPQMLLTVLHFFLPWLSLFALSLFAHISNLHSADLVPVNFLFER